MRQRIVTAIILGIVFIPMAMLSNKTATVLYTILMFATLFEYLKSAYMTDSDAFPKLFLGFLTSAGIFSSLFYFKPGETIISIAFAVVIAFIFLNILLLLTKKKALITSGPYFLMVQLYITIPIVLLIHKLDKIEHLNLMVFGVIVLIWLSDIGAYFVGKFLGKHKLFVEISPNKTWEGFFGGGIFVLLGAYGLSFLDQLNLSLSQWLIIGFIVWITGSLGDLVESSYKRYFKIKDSGTMLPGHGGFLDRFDSFIFAIPVVLAYLHFTS